MMRTYEQWRNYREQELIERHPPAQELLEVQILSFFQQIWDSWRGWWCSSNEPQISEITDSTGQPRWKIYDPIRDHSFQLESHQDVLIWLEQRHH